MGDESFEYLTVEDVLAIHEVIVESSAETTAGVSSRGDVAYALEHVESGHFGQKPDSIHEKGYQILRLLVANHPFVDGNKRTGLRALVLTFELGGGTLRYGADAESLVRLLATDERMVDIAHVADYLDRQSTDGEAPDESTLTDPERRTAFVRERTREDIEAHRELYDRLADS
jgi:death-on-curing protein